MGIHIQCIIHTYKAKDMRTDMGQYYFIDMEKLKEDRKIVQENIKK